MDKDEKVDILKNVLLIIGVITFVSILIWQRVDFPGISLLAAWALYQPTKSLYHCLRNERNFPVRILNKCLPKIGCKIKEVEHYEEDNLVRLVVQYNEVTFLFDVIEPSRTVSIIFPDFGSIKADSPNMLKVLEVLSLMNDRPGPSCGLSEIDEEDNCRHLHLYESIILPTKAPGKYVEGVLDQMIWRMDMFRNLRSYVEGTMDKRPYLSHSPRKPIGFNVSPNQTEGEKTEDVAAQTTQNI